MQFGPSWDPGLRLTRVAWGWEIFCSLFFRVWSREMGDFGINSTAIRASTHKTVVDTLADRLFYSAMPTFDLSEKPDAKRTPPHRRAQ